jgi:hypothetical protein
MIILSVFLDQDRTMDKVQKQYFYEKKTCLTLSLQNPTTTATEADWERSPLLYGPAFNPATHVNQFSVTVKIWILMQYFIPGHIHYF